MIKADCRKIFTEKRNALSKKEQQNLSWEIIQQLHQYIELNGKTISLFLPILAKKEVDTYPILLDSENNNYRVALPIANFESNTMQHVLFESLHQIKVSSFGIPEPSEGKSVNAKEIDIVFVPLLCVDKKGYRVGYGKGFYDRFLLECRPDCQFIGLSFFEPIEEIEDKNEFDIPLSACITPIKYHTF